MEERLLQLAEAIDEDYNGGPPSALQPPFREYLRARLFPTAHEVIEFEADYYRVHRTAPVTGYPKPKRIEWFDNIILAIVLLNTLIVALDRPEGSGKRPAGFEMLDKLFTVIFTLEVVTRMLAFGLFRMQPTWSLSPSGYFRDPWNVFDFFIVVTSIIDTVASSTLSQAEPPVTDCVQRTAHAAPPEPHRRSVVLAPRLLRQGTCP